MLRPFNRSIHLWLLAYAIAGFTNFGVQAIGAATCEADRVASAATLAP